MSLTDKTISGSFKDLLQMDNGNNGVDTSTRYIKDGEGTQSALAISDDTVAVRPNNDDTTGAFNVVSALGTSVLAVDTTNQLVTASGNIVNTQYAYFMVDMSDTSNFAANTHQPIPFQGGMSSILYPPTFGTTTDPALSFTTSDGNGTRASDLIPMIWFVPDAISIDSVTSFEGADAATGDTTRMHLFSYTFNTGSTSALTSGTLLAYNSDVTNAGSEQAYKSSWTVDSEDVNGGSVVLAFFRSDSINSDYSKNIVIKYHLR